MKDTERNPARSLGRMAGLALAAVLAIAAPALAADRGPAIRPVFLAHNNLLVYPMQDGTFEVQARAGTSGPDYFCAAGDYAWTMLNVPVASRVVVVRADGPSTTNPGGRGMLFKVVPQGAASNDNRSFTVSMRRVGENFSVAHSRALCTRSGGLHMLF
ncbi:MAG: hypothetical protein KDA73_19370 [Rhodobacteraceae bacterium]|nr:hypothetical protein [Paracoccaceae bacterium]